MKNDYRDHIRRLAARMGAAMTSDYVPDPDDMEEATFCEHCDATHWPSDESAANSDDSGWRCETCGRWNDRATD